MILSLRRIALAFLLLALVGAVTPLLGVVPVGAAMTRHVTTCDGNATTEGSLPNVVAAAGAGDTIVFDRDCPAPGGITLAATLVIAVDLTIDATNPAHTVALDGHGALTVIAVNANVTATLRSLAILNGQGSRQCIGGNFPPNPLCGGGIFTATGSTVTVTNCTIEGNATTNNGGGVDNNGTLTVTDSAIAFNIAGIGGGINNESGSTLNLQGGVINTNVANALDGGGINSQGTLSVSGATIRDNKAVHGGGGINDNGTAMTITGSTISGNIAQNNFGGGIFTGGGLIANSTISANYASFGGGGIGGISVTVIGSTITANIASGGGGGVKGRPNTINTITLADTIVAGNTILGGGGSDVDSIITSGGHNLVGNTGNSSGWVGSDLLNRTPLVGMLAPNGGPTQTVSLLTGSPAIGAGDPAICNGATLGGKDQRGIIRPTALCAIGAFEPLLSAISPTSGATAGGNRVTLIGAGIAPGATVMLGGVPCAGVTIVNSTTLTCIAPVHIAGIVDVTVTVNGVSGTKAGAYTYGASTPLPPPQPTVAPVTGPNPLPVARPTGSPVSGTPNPLPPSR